jgi:hypothetical protein
MTMRCNGGGRLRNRARLFCGLLALLPLAATAQERAAPSLYEHVVARIDPLTGRLRPGSETLPDESPGRRPPWLRWAPGAFDGVGTHHLQWDGSGKARQVADLLVIMVAGADAAAENELYELLRADDVVTYYEDALDLAASRIADPKPQLHAYARGLVTRAAHRGPVKLGLALLGAIGDPADLALAETLGLHDEFTLYAVEALAGLAPDPQRRIFLLAQKVTGWGRIQAVERLMATQDPHVRRWLLTEGFRNTVLPDYLAYHCAVIGDLAQALRSPNVDPLLLAGAADIVRALAQSGPARNFDDYPEAGEVAVRFLELAADRHDALELLLAAYAIKDYVAHDARPHAARAASGWTAAQLERVGRLADRIVSDARWRATIDRALREDGAALDAAVLAARRAGIEAFDAHVAQLALGPEDARRWEHAFDGVRADRVDWLVQLAVDKLLEPAPRPRDAALASVISSLRRHPGRGIALVAVGLSHPDLEVRRASVDTLARWGSGFFAGDAQMRARLRDAARAEGDEAVRARMVAVLNLD